MIKYSTRALSGLSFLFRPFNDLDVYVEDDASHNLYELLISRILGEQAKVSRVFQLGGREEVIEACRNDQDPRNRKRLYLIDGDFDILTGQTQPNLKHLYRLSVYCSENLVISEQSIIEVAYECNPNESRESLYERLEIDSVFNEIHEYLYPLLVIYVVVKNHDDTIPTMSFNVTQLIKTKNNNIELSDEKIEARITEIINKLEESIENKRLEIVIKETEQILSNYPQPVLLLFSGKTYIVPLIFHYLHRKASYRGTIRELVVRLARHCELDIDPGLYNAVRVASQSHYHFVA